jgi:hypothetical protein
LADTCNVKTPLGDALSGRTRVMRNLAIAEILG